MRELERDHTSSATEDAAHPSIALIGDGRLGGTLARQAATAAIPCRVGTREELAEATAEAEIALLCVPDAEITGVCAALVASSPQLRFIGHPSGASELGVLSPAADAGVETFSLHPLQTIPDREATLAGAPAAIAGSGPEALAVADRLAVALGMRPFELPENSRAAYHAAASIASNFLVALEESAAGLLGAAGVENGRELLTPLVLRSAANWAERGSAALTGPIARGDEATVERHRAALAELAPELLPIYEALAERTGRLAAGPEESHR